MSRRLLALLAFFCGGCGSLPKVPHHVQYGNYPQVTPPGFYGVDNESQAHVFHAWTDAEMVGAQCLTVDDYRAFQAWVASVKQIAERRCQ